jgi:dihydropteroate synthase
VMGVVNITPDSFSDGGLFLEADAAIEHGELLASEGAAILDIGGESTRPGAPPIAPDQQIARIEHALVHAARERRAVVSVDTTSPRVAAYALAQGASIVNDVSCLADATLARVVADAGASLVIMHARGSMSDMRGFSDAPGDAYDDVVDDVRREWSAARERAVDQGLDPREIVLDPGLGYMKNASHSLQLLQRLGELTSLGAPILVGPSRKSFIAKTLGIHIPPTARLGGSIAACLAAADRGAAILRVHDVFEVRQALAIHRAIGARDA